MTNRKALLLLFLALPVSAYQGGTIKNHAHTTASGDGGALSINTLVGASSVVSDIKYRRPYCVWQTSNTVIVETGTVTGLSSDSTVLFPDNTLLTVTNNTAETTLDIRQTANLKGLKRGGISALAATNLTWYSILAVKAADSTTDYVLVADTNPFVAANFAYFNSTYTANGYVHLCDLPNGDNGGASDLGNNSGISSFTQSGPRIYFWNTGVGQGSTNNSQGIRLATGAGVASISWTYASGMTVGSQVPPNILIGDVKSSMQASSSQCQIQNKAASFSYVILGIAVATGPHCVAQNAILPLGFTTTASGTTNQDLWLTSYQMQDLAASATPFF